MEKELSFKNSLCSQKWASPIVNFAQQSVRTCCRTPISGHRVTAEDLKRHGTGVFLNNPYQKERRREMFQGIRHSDCEHCWKLETNGVRSVRKNVENPGDLARFGNHAHAPVDLLQISADHPILESHRPTELNIELSNLCDAKCIYCNRHFSSKWAAEDLKEGRVDKKTLEQDHPKDSSEFERLFWEWFEEIKTSPEHISIIGGEPLISPLYYKLLERLCASGPETPKAGPMVMITTVTNLNTPPVHMDRFLALLPELTKRYRLNLDVSMDGTGERAEYIREGVKWRRWLENMRRIMAAKPPNFLLGIQPSINALCVTTLKELLGVIRDLRDEYKMPCLLRSNVVTYPRYLSPFVLPREYAEHLHAAASFVREVSEPAWGCPDPLFADNWRSYGDYLAGLGDAISRNEPSRLEMGQLYKQLSENDRVRGRSFTATFPEYAAFWETCRSLAVS